jgi:hypothetical protein
LGHNNISLSFILVVSKCFSISKLYSVDDKIINECGAVDGMRIGRGNRSSRRKSAIAPLLI